MTSDSVVAVLEEWHREDSYGSTLLYTLRQEGWRKGQPVMVNDVAVRIERHNGSVTDIEPIVQTILSALRTAARQAEKGVGA